MEMKYEVISRYSTEEAIADGVLVRVGEIEDWDVLFTTHLVEELSKEDLLSALYVGLVKARAMNGPDIAEFSIGGRRVWVDDNAYHLTFMLPEDY